MKKPLITMLDCNKSKKESLKLFNNQSDINLDVKLETDEKKLKMELENKHCFELS